MRIKRKKTTIDGIRFDSQGEAGRYVELKLLERAGEIRNLQCHPEFPLVIAGRRVVMKSKRYNKGGRKCVYTADFEYLDLATNELVLEDFKGYETPMARFRIAVFEAIYNRNVRIVK